MTKAEAGRLGGLPTAQKYGSSYMSEIGRKGAAITWARYRLVPAGVSGWLIVNRQTDEARPWNGRIGR